MCAALIRAKELFLIDRSLTAKIDSCARLSSRLQPPARNKRHIGVPESVYIYDYRRRAWSSSPSCVSRMAEMSINPSPLVVCAVLATSDQRPAGKSTLALFLMRRRRRRRATRTTATRSLFTHLCALCRMCLSTTSRIYFRADAALQIMRN